MDYIDEKNFINNMIKYAATEESPDYILSGLVRYIGETLEADRAYIFEENADGTFDNTYEWCREGVTAEIDNLKSVPYDGVLEIWYNEFKLRRNMIIYDMEEYKNVSQVCYDYLAPQGINSLVAGPIVSGKKRAFYGVDNPPQNRLEQISVLLIEEVEGLLGLVLRMKEYTKTIINMASMDALTGCGNRAALERKYEKFEKTDKALCVLMCDLNGLKKKNDNEGHKAGDKYLSDFAGILMDCFGKENCYRIGGDEFLVVQAGVEFADMKEKKTLLLNRCQAAYIYVSVGMEYVKKVEESFEKLMHRADVKMYEAKKKYYNSKGNDRRM